MWCGLCLKQWQEQSPCPTFYSSKPPRPLARPPLQGGEFDTGATRTCITGLIADALELTPVGFSKAHTASGVEEFADYAVDILFPDAGLLSFEDLNVGSCSLPYMHYLSDEQRMAHTNIGALIGRDMMSRWNIVWNGPSSSVFVSE